MSKHSHISAILRPRFFRPITQSSSMICQWTKLKVTLFPHRLPIRLPRHASGENARETITLWKHDRSSRRPGEDYHHHLSGRSAAKNKPSKVEPAVQARRWSAAAHGHPEEARNFEARLRGRGRNS